MAGKRTASSDLNHDNWDREEEAEEAGTFKRATDDVLKKRVIKTAKRRGAGSGTTEGGDSGEKKSIFGGFTAFTKTPADPTSAFSFLKTPTVNTNGTEKTQAPPQLQTVNKKSDEYYAKLKGLNESVAKWIKKHVDENPFVNLKPVFTDYDKYFNEIESEKAEKSAPVFSVPKQKTENLPNFGATNSTKIETPQFSFGAKKESTSPKAMFTFGAKKEEVDFSAKKDEPVKIGFTFSNSTFSTPATSTPATSAPVSAPFTFGNVSKPVVPNKTDENEDEDEPPKVEFTPVVEEDHIYTSECKVFVKKDGNYGDRGLGTLYLKPVPDSEKCQLIVRANTNLGNLLCNLILSSSIPTQRMGKKDVMLVCIPTPDSKPPPVPILIRVKTPEKADELLKTLEKHKK